MGEFSKTSTVPFCSLLSSLRNWQDAKMPETRSPMSHTNRPASMSRDHSPCQLPHHWRCAICDTLIQVLGYMLLVSGYFDNCLERNPNLERDFPTTSPSSPLLTLAPPFHTACYTRCLIQVISVWNSGCMCCTFLFISPSFSH